MYLTPEDRKIKNVEDFIAAFLQGVRPQQLNLAEFDKKLLSDLVTKMELVEVYHEYPEIYCVIRDAMTSRIAPSNCYARLFAKLAKDIQSVQSQYRVQCLLVLEFSMCRTYLRDPLIRELSVEEVTRLLANIYSHVMTPSQVNLAILFAEIPDKIDVRMLLRMVEDRNERMTYRVKTMLEKYL